MATFALWGCAAVGAVSLTVLGLICTAIAVAGAVRRIKALAAVTGRKRWDLADMPGHPERLRRLDDLAADTTFWDLAELLLDDPREPRLAEVCERLGWLR